MNTLPQEFIKFLSRVPPEILPFVPFIPIIAGTKKPDIPKGESAKDEKYQLTPEATLKRIVGGGNAAMYAQKGGLWFLDEDVRKGKLILPLEKLDCIPFTFTVKTRNGGRQNYFLNDGKFENKVHFYNGEKAGEIRADWEYVLCPGSFVKPDEHATPDADGLYKILLNSPIINIEKIPDSITIKKKESNSQDNYENDFGAKLSEIRHKDIKLNQLLNGADACGYPSRSEADMAVVQKLYFWRFNEPDIAKIVREYRPYEKTLRDDYLETTIKNKLPGERYDPNFKGAYVPHKVDEVVQEVNTMDDIPLPQEDLIPPISFEGLPEYSFHKLFIKYMGKISDTYPEYSFQNATAALSALTRRRIYLKLNGRQEFTNMITLNLGQSGYARKGSALFAAHDFLHAGIGDTFLSQDVSPEGLISEMSDTITTTKRTKDGSEESLDYPQKNKIRKAVSALWKDEAGQFYSQLNKPHMQSLKELLCHFYDCPDEYNKTLSAKKFHIGEIFFSMNLATTQTSFIQNVTTKDVHTGFLARHNIVNPSYQKIRKPITEDSDDDLITETAFAAILKIIDKLLPEKPLRVRIGTEELRILDDWCKDREEYFAKERNETMGSFFARFQINVLKTATLIDLGNIPASLYLYNNGVDSKYFENKIIISLPEIISQKGFLLTHAELYLNNILLHLTNSNISDYIISTMCISKSSLLYAMKIYDSVFIPYSYQICINSKVDLFTNYLSNIYKILQEKKKIERSNLMRLSNVSKRQDFDEAIETLKEAGAVIEYKVRGKTKPITAYVYVPTPYTKLKFTPSNYETEVDNGLIELTKIHNVCKDTCGDNTSANNANSIAIDSHQGVESDSVCANVANPGDNTVTELNQRAVYTISKAVQEWEHLNNKTLYESEKHPFLKWLIENVDKNTPASEAWGMVSKLKAFTPTPDQPGEITVEDHGETFGVMVE